MDLKKEIIDDIEKAQLSAEEILRKYDKESDKRELTGIWNTIINAICIVFCIFQVYTAAFGILDAQLQRAIHLAFGFALVFLLYPMRQSWSRKEMNWIDVGFAVVGVAVSMYIVVFYHDLVLRAGMNNETDYIIALIGTLLVIEGARRVVGWPMITIAILFVLYGLFGRMLPGIIAHRGLGLHELVNYLYYTTEGIFGTPMGVSSTFIYLFILFGAYLETTGLGKFFIDISNAIAGWASGGPAKVAVISSALEGTVSGSSVANVVGSGSFTIPMMKKLGYGKDFAGAVEAAASTGGQLMPPVMGAAAFLMAEFVGVPYMEVVKAGVIPAILYFTGIWLGVHFEAKKLGLKGMSRDEMPSYKSIFVERGHLIIPLIAIIYFLTNGYTPMRAALVGIVLAIVSSCLRKSTRITFKDFVNGMINGSKGILGVLIACATAGIIIGVVTKTGVGLKMATALLDLAGGHLMPAMVFTMLTSLILGMGVPTTANYVITSTIAAPALIQMDVPVLAAHMFVFYFGIVADITPPVALAAYAGSGISGGDPLRTGINASKLAIAAFIIPYIFVLSPEILMINATPFGVIFSCCTAILGMVGVAAAMGAYFTRHLNFLQRCLFFFGGLGLIDPGLYTDVAGVVLMAIGYLWSRKNPK
jgi:TRAP transporter 4TM/12TM fusion protein